MSVALVAVGPVPEPPLARIEECVRAAFRLEVRRLSPVAEPAEAYVPSRGQWSSSELLRVLLQQRPPGCSRLLGVTERDLFVPVLSFVYGQAQLGGAAAVFSLARLRPEFHALPSDAAALQRRAAVEAVHELGHTFGLVHCRRPHCPMSLSVDLADLDRKTAELCPGCSALLEGSLPMKRTRAQRTADRP
ncbi:MAG TPA: archaemetzincin [Vicinamibacteria bacterium]|nr:archaemetzincin [Vicinamibacteria bacterium]